MRVSEAAALNGNKEVRFCPYCATKLDVGARFCKGCGQPVEQSVQGTSQAKSEGSQINKGATDDYITERKVVYEGYIHKCPNCGEVLGSFVTYCPSCGHEIRGVKSTSSVREFALKLERIEAQKIPIFEEKRSVMKSVFGKDFNEKDEVKEARDDFIEQKRQEKANLIINYSVPNTKEDIMEFMLLADSNLNIRHGVDDTVSKAWISKLSQVYKKAKISMGDSPDFEQIKDMYTKKKKQIRFAKIIGLVWKFGGVLLYFLLMAFLWSQL